MTWQELGAVGELTGAFAALVLLGYIAYQIRQNSQQLEQNARSTRATIYQNSSDGYARFWALLAQDPDLAKVWRRVYAGEEIDEDETIRFEALLHVLVAHLEQAYIQMEMGTYDDVLSQGEALVSQILSVPPASSWWHRGGHRSFRPHFVETINRMLEPSKDARE